MNRGRSTDLARGLRCGRLTRAFAALTIVATVAFAAPALARAANPAANIDQCRNGTVASPAQCADSAWVNGNLGETNSHYREADFVPFRATLTNLDPSASSHTVTIQYDTLQGTSHAYDYLGSYNATEASADPTTGLAGLSAGNCFAVPVDLTNVFANPGSTQTPGCIQIWNGTITGVSYGVADAAGKRSLVVTFSASSPTVLLAWGGHVASQIDWGLGNSASAISGSPYHMRLLTLDDSQLGNQDRSIKAAAILPIPPGFTTQASPSQISVGQSVTDTATLSGTSSNGAVTGNVTFFVCGPAAANPDCTAGGNQVGSPVAIATGQAVSAPFAPGAAGSYCFRAEYAPDATAAYSPSHHTNQTTECFSVANPSLEISKAADDASVSAGDPIGFTIDVSNPGPGTALGVTVSDLLPSGNGVSWSIDGAGSDSGCSIAGGTLSCDFGDLAASASKHVHVTSPTTSESCKTYPNTATAQATNNTPVQASASTKVDCAQIAISKLADAATVSAGDQIGFTITLSNSGAGIARNVSANDLLPTNAGTSWTIDAANSDSGWTIQNGALGYGPHDLAPGASVHVHIVSPSSKETCGNVDNTASVSTSNDGSGQANASVEVDCPDIEVTKTAGASAVDAGDAASFTIRVENVGSGIARNVVLDDPLPGGLNWSDDSADCSIAGGSLHCAFGDLAAGASRIVHISAPTTPAVCGKLPNTATAAADNEPDDALANDSDGATVEVDCPHIKLVKTADAASVSAGDRIGFTITVSNAGPGAAHDVHVSDALPANSGLEFSIADQSDAGACVLNPGKTELECSKPSLAADASFSVHIVSATAPATCGTVENAASVEVSNGNGDSDAAAVDVDCPDVRVVKTADEATISAGETAAFTIVVSNVGSGIARNVTLDDPLPPGVSWSEDSANCSIEAGSLRCSFGDLLPDATRSVHVSGPTAPANCGKLDNTATVAAANEREDARANDSDSASITVECPNLSLTKTADAASVKAGQQLGFKLTVTNSGVGSAKDVHIVDKLPSNAALSFTVDAAHSDAGCAIAGGTLTCSFGNLGRGASRSVHLVSPTGEATCGNVDNSATADSANGSAVQAAASVKVGCPIVDLAITKVDDPDPLFVNDTLTYTLGVRNNGPDTATAVVVTDSLPADVAFVSATPSQGTCSGDRVLTCQLGTLAAGATASITVVVHPTATGTITNTAVVAGHETESDLSNNTASADTRVRGRLTPPVCYSLSVRPRLLTVGHRTVVRIGVRAGSKVAVHVPVSLRGAGIARTARTDRRGIARLVLVPRKVGLIRVRVPNRRSCSSPQIGVAGVFKPPHFTG